MSYKENCPTCGTPCTVEYAGLNLVEETGDETLVSKSYTPITASPSEKSQSGLQWVKASERVPEKHKWVVIRGEINETPFATYGRINHWDENPQIYFEVGSRSFLSNEVEWLSEGKSEKREDNQTASIANQSGEDWEQKFYEWHADYKRVNNRHRPPSPLIVDWIKRYVLKEGKAVPHTSEKNDTNLKQKIENRIKHLKTGRVKSNGDFNAIQNYDTAIAELDYVLTIMKWIEEGVNH